jgi:hypothetical protein
VTGRKWPLRTGDHNIAPSTHPKKGWGDIPPGSRRLGVDLKTPESGGSFTGSKWQTVKAHEKKMPTNLIFQNGLEEIKKNDLKL